MMPRPALLKDSRPLRLMTAILALSAGVFLSPMSRGATINGSVGASMTFPSACIVAVDADTTSVAFPQIVALPSGQTTTGTIGVKCTAGTTFSVGMDQGAGPGATVTSRTMSGPGGATIAYGLYMDSALTRNWGQTEGTDTLGGTADGGVDLLTVYAKEPSQPIPVQGFYADSVNITVFY